MNKHLRVLGIVAPSLFLGCATDPVGGVQSALLISVLDWSGQPVPWRSVRVTVYSADSDTVLIGRSDSTGQVGFAIPNTPRDSIRAQTIQPLCAVWGGVDTLVIPRRGSGIVQLQLISPQATRAPVAPGQSCAWWQTNDIQIELALQIDSIIDRAVLGIWRISFNYTRIPEEGTFEGIVTDKAIGLWLTAVGGPQHCEVRYTVVAEIDEFNRFGSGRLSENGGCRIEEGPVELILENRLQFP